MLMRKLGRMSLVVAVGLGVVAMAGCGKKGGGGGGGGMGPAGGSKNPADAIKGVIESLGAGDAAAAASYFPSDDVLAKALDCGPEGRLIAEVVKARDGMKKDADEIKAEGATLRYISSGPGAPKSIAKGETIEGCTAKVDITVIEYTFKFEMSKGDKKREREKTKPVAQFGDSGWYVMED